MIEIILPSLSLFHEAVPPLLKAPLIVKSPPDTPAVTLPAIPWSTVILVTVSKSFFPIAFPALTPQITSVWAPAPSPVSVVSPSPFKSIAALVPVTVNFAVESLPALEIVTTLPPRLAVLLPSAPSIARDVAPALSPFAIASTSFRF